MYGSRICRGCCGRNNDGLSMRHVADMFEEWVLCACDGVYGDEERRADIGACVKGIRWRPRSLCCQDYVYV